MVVAENRCPFNRGYLISRFDCIYLDKEVFTIFGQIKSNLLTVRKKYDRCKFIFLC